VPARIVEGCCLLTARGRFHWRKGQWHRTIPDRRIRDVRLAAFAKPNVGSVHGRSVSPGASTSAKAHLPGRELCQRTAQQRLLPTSTAENTQAPPWGRVVTAASVLGVRLAARPRLRVLCRLRAQEMLKNDPQRASARCARDRSDPHATELSWFVLATVIAWMSELYDHPPVFVDYGEALTSSTWTVTAPPPQRIMERGSRLGVEPSRPGRVGNPPLSNNPPIRYLTGRAIVLGCKLEEVTGPVWREWKELSDKGDTRRPRETAALNQATICSSCVVLFRRCPPSAVTVTMSSMRTPKRPGR
jgi:hypothetical protein